MGKQNRDSATRKANSVQPVIIIGAARSGTNMLRDILTQLSSFGTWPCDEIPYVWRHGNVRYLNDELEPQHATPAVKGYIHHFFASLAKNNKLDVVVEKTCANSLRVGFINEIFPEANYIFLVRDGRDVVASAMKRWVAPLNIPYLLKKARYVPVSDIPYYGVRFLWNRIYQIGSKEKRLAFWGPRFEGMDEMLRTRSLPEVCAAQWARCVEKSAQELAQIDGKRVYQLRYEDFVQNPTIEMKRLLEFLAIEIPEEQLEVLVSGVSVDSVGKWKNDLTSDTLDLVMPLIEPLLIRYDYI